MLSETLKKNSLHEFNAEVEEKRKQAGRTLLKNAVDDLVTAMNAVERDGTYTRDDIEAYVLKCLEFYERQLYSMDDEDFDDYLDEKLVKAMRRMRHE